MRTADCTANALGLRFRSSSCVDPPCFLSFFFSAFGPLCFCWCCFCFFTFPSILSTEAQTISPECIFTERGRDRAQWKWSCWDLRLYSLLLQVQRRIYKVVLVSNVKYSSPPPLSSALLTTHIIVKTTNTNNVIANTSSTNKSPSKRPLLTWLLLVFRGLWVPPLRIQFVILSLTGKKNVPDYVFHLVIT